MKRFLVILAILAVAASAHADSWNYYKGTGGDAWGSTPIVTQNGWIMNQPAGTSQLENGVLWTSINALPVGTAISFSFDLNTVNMPCIGAFGGEGDGGVWCEVYIKDMATAGTSATAQQAMQGTLGPWTNKMTTLQAYNNYWGWGGGQWQSGYEWKVGGPSHVFVGNDIDGAKTFNDTHHFTFSTASTAGNIFIGIKTGVYNQGLHGEMKGGYYGQNVTNMNVTIPLAGDDDLLPEPSSFLALGTGLMGLAGIVIRRKK